MSQDVIQGHTAAPLLPASDGFERALLVARAAWWPLLMTVAALVLRTYHLQVISWIPDNYEQLAATERLLHLDFPLSLIYSPGVAMIMAPFVAVFPHDIATLQGVIVAAGVAMVPLGYLAALRLTRDRLAATLFAAVIAIDPSFVYKSRDPHYDLLVAFLLGALLALLPALRRGSILGAIGYGFLLSLMINIRPTNVACLAALAVYWGALQLEDDGWRAFLRSLVSPRLVAVALTAAVFLAGGAVLGGWWGRTTGVSLTFENYSDHVIFYAQVMLGGWPLLPLELLLASFGLWRLRRANQALALGLLALVVTWPLAHAPFSWATARYMLPAQLCVLFLATFGAAQAWTLTEALRSPWRGLLRRGVAPFLVLTTAAFLVVPSLIILDDWPTITARSDEGALRQLRPTIGGLDGRSLVVSTAALGLRNANPGIEHADLIDYHIRLGTGNAGQAALVDVVAKALDEGRPVYYLYTRWEDGIDYEGDGRSGFVRYWQALSSRFEVTPILQSPPTADPNVRPWKLYRVEKPQTKG
jgi:hypothetical protein